MLMLIDDFIDVGDFVVDVNDDNELVITTATNPTIH
jgi:hypothetical protein